PALQHLQPAVLEHGHVELDGVALADAIQAADPLFQQVRVQGQVEQYQMTTELEVATFAADFRTYQNLGAALGTGKIGGNTIAVHNIHMAVEHSAADTGVHPQVFLQADG